jgi:endonuclease YncB( thermonuclease family)
MMSAGKRVLLFLAIILAIPVFQGCKAMFTPQHVEVLSVKDGNTILVAIDGKERIVDLQGVDVPKIATETDPAECLGPEAKKHLESLAPVGSEIELKELTDDGAAKVKGPHGERVNEEMVRSGLGVSSDDSAVGLQPDEGLLDKKIACTLPGQIAALEVSASSTFHDGDRSTSAQIATGIATLETVKKSAVALSGLIAGDTRTGPSLILKSNEAAKDLTSDLGSLTTRLDGYIEDLRKAHDTKAQREAEAVASAQAEAVRKAEWDAGAPAREAANRAWEERLRALDAEGWNGSASSDSGYTGRRCYSSGGKGYRQC